MVFALAVTAVPANAQDALICRKRDKQGEKAGQVTHLRGNGVYYNAGDGNDTVYGTPGDDIIDGGRGDDKVYGEGGNDIVCGGLDNDKVFGGRGNDEVYGEEDNDYLVGGPGNDYMLGAAGLDRLIGYGKKNGVYTDDGSDFMEGSYLSDVLVAGGFDTMYGGADDDILSSKTPNSGAARMDGGLNNDTIFGSDAADNLLYGDTGDDIIRGGGGNDTIRGGNNDDTIFGDNGDDQLFGELGKDILSGGNDNDVCDGAEQEDRADDTCEQKVDIP